jgi:ribose transport system permease protein
MRGLARGISGRGTVTYNNPGLTNFFITPIAGRFPVQFFVLLISVGAMFLVVNRTKFGFDVEAYYGNNPVAARISGINTRRVTTTCYVISAMFAWVSGIWLWLSSTEPARVGVHMELDAIAATVIPTFLARCAGRFYAIAAVVMGGARLTGGVGNVSGTVAGTLIIGAFSNIFNLQRFLDPVWELVVVGCVLLAVVFLQSLVERYWANAKIRRPLNAKGQV